MFLCITSPNGKAEWKSKVNKYFFTMFSNAETAFFFQLWVSDSQEGYTLPAPRLQY